MTDQTTDREPSAGGPRDATPWDASAWEALVDRFAGMVWAVARSHRLDAADAADVSQTTWLRLLEHLDRLERPDRVGAWLATTARRESLRRLQMDLHQVPADPSMLDLTRNVQPSPEGTAMVADHDRVLWELFSSLSPRCQLILRLLRADSPLSYQDLAAALDMPIGSIGPTRARCLEHLRRQLVGAGLSLDD